MKSLKEFYWNINPVCNVWFKESETVRAWKLAFLLLRHPLNEVMIFPEKCYDCKAVNGPHPVTGVYQLVEDIGFPNYMGIDAGNVEDN